eukprot:CAMPEP_0181448130 /NCGR_PEP_ID=MMETSP1110-20121109/26981_1 /TAXON_ID=174948 /ORGANISM="Symbiodinium sp., Strain CCMP421" /LENGTH=34 /DNA_ID= /DNA_START= /DNA_END= /DNA_ORIENTATION=
MAVLKRAVEQAQPTPYAVRCPWDLSEENGRRVSP